MKIIISLNNLNDKLVGERYGPLRARRPKALIEVSGQPILAHILNQMRPLFTQETDLLLVGEDHLDVAVTWVQTHYAQLRVTAVANSPTISPLWACRAQLNDEPVLFAASDSLVVAEFAALQGDLGVDAAVLISDKEQPGRFGSVIANEDGQIETIGSNDGGELAVVGAYWFRSGGLIRSQLTEQIKPAALAQSLITSGATVLAGGVTDWIEINSYGDFLNANKRLLGIGYGTDEALGRSYIEEFAVIPPVYLHPDAEVTASVIGPYASVGAGAVIRNSVVRNCIIEEGAMVENIVLEKSIIGRDSQITGSMMRDLLITKQGQTTNNKAME